MRFSLALFTAIFLPFAAQAQERPDTILVMDGSGSMWGQIDGVNKIVIAREVVAEILGDFPADQGLGLTAYGHRTEGDCSDIETLVAPAPGTAPQIIASVNGINPRGKTPMTDAVIAAAEALGYREGPATVILVSDGIETCNPDPCAAARALEAGGGRFHRPCGGLRRQRCRGDWPVTVPRRGNRRAIPVGLQRQRVKPCPDHRRRRTAARAGTRTRARACPDPRHLRSGHRPRWPAHHRSRLLDHHPPAREHRGRDRGEPPLARHGRRCL